MKARALAGAATAALLFACSLTAPAPAQAHVHVGGDDPVRGGMALLTFTVPNESTTGAATSELTVTLPDVASARAEALAGWTATLQHDTAAGTTGSVTWTAENGGGIPVDQFGLFRLSVLLPDADTVSFPATQTYTDGEVVRWDQPTAADGSEPEYPAPVLHLVAGSAGSSEHGVPAVTATQEPRRYADHLVTSDVTARVLGGIALLLGGLALGVSVGRRRRS